VRPLLIVFAKSPEAGKVKSRLVPTLSPEAAARLHEAMVGDTLARVQELEGEFDIELHTDAFSEHWSSAAFPRKLQASGGLGDRLYSALHAGLSRGHPLVVITGSDAPTLPASHLQELARLEADVALGPCADGGFYAIASRRLDAAMFDGVVWSDARTLDQTCDSIRRCGLSVRIGPEWYDVDTPDDLLRLSADATLGVHTRRALREIDQLMSESSF
jgi:uncharacterized protein